MHYTNEKVTIRFDGGIEFSRPWLAADMSRAQRVLRKHCQERASCLCTPYGVPMHVVCRFGRYHLATMPGRGHHHALSCPSYLPDDDASGLRHYSPSALSRAAGRHKLAVSHDQLGLPPFNHFTPSASLQFIWEFSGLNVSTPKTVSVRNYYLVANSLYRNILHVRFNGDALRPYIPLAVDSPDQCRYVLGQVRRVTHGKYANGLMLAADKKNSFWVDESEWARSGISSVFGPYDTPTKATGVWVIGKLWRSQQNNLRLFDVGFLTVSPEFLPYQPSTAEILSNLVDSGRRFFICQRYDSVHDDTIPAAVVIDRDEPRSIFLPSGV